jgi:hypothetical protein
VSVEDKNPPVPPKPTAEPKPSLFQPVASKPKTYSEHLIGKKKRG